MPERPVARPRPTVAPELKEADRPEATADAGGAAVSPVDLADAQFDSDFADARALEIEVEHDLDPVQALIEQAAVLFANGQDSAARAVLESSARANVGADAERLWRMLLDLVQVLGDRSAFDKLGMEFAQTCEKSPPAWRAADGVKTAVRAGRTVVAVQGVVTGADAPEFAGLQTAIKAGKPLTLDLGRLVSCDNEAATALCEVSRLARKQAVDLALEGADGLLVRLEARLHAGHADTPGLWLLLLELYQRLGKQELFEEKAVDYAVTFEVSPPSWEVVKTPAAKAAPTMPASAPASVDDALYLYGDLKNYRFTELPEYLESHAQPVIDLSHVKRLDFFSAGLLANTLEPFKRGGKDIVIRHPHHLIAELLGIVGVSKTARIIVAKV